MNRKLKTKICPFLDSNCLKSQCGLYHEDFDRCYIGLLADNLYKEAMAAKVLTEALKDLPKSIFRED